MEAGGEITACYYGDMQYVEIVIVDALYVDIGILSAGFRVNGDNAFHAQAIADEAAGATHGKDIGVG